MLRAPVDDNAQQQRGTHATDADDKQNTQQMHCQARLTS